MGKMLVRTQMILTMKTLLGAYYVPSAGGHKDVACLKNESCIHTYVHTCKCIWKYVLFKYI